jgi:hypothetical protein
MESSFSEDLEDEQILGFYMDSLYPSIFESTSYEAVRKIDLESQYKGIDLKLFNSKKSYAVDEKAQLNYLNKRLPTFAFEISYLKDNNWHLGWLFDESKETDIYFLITGIFTVNKSLTSGISKVTLTGVYRSRLLNFLASKGLTKSTVLDLAHGIRSSGIDGSSALSELNPSTEGKLFFSKKNKAEQPINLVLKLDFLISVGVAKRLLN